MSIAETTKLTRTIQRRVPELVCLPRPVYARAEDMTQRSSTHEHSHPWVQFSYASQGVLHMETPGAVLIAPPQWGILVPPGQPHTVKNTAGTRMRSLYIAHDRLPRVIGHCVVVHVSELLGAMIRHFSGMPVQYDEQGAEGRLVQVMLDLIQNAPRADLALPWPEHAGLQALCTRFMKETGTRHAVSGHWSRALNISERTLGRLFVQETRLTLRTWLQRARLLQSIPMLETGLSVTDTALACGYDSTSAFIAAFHAFMGQTPGSLQRKRSHHPISTFDPHQAAERKVSAT